MDKIKNNFAVNSKKGCNFGLLVIATRIFLEKSFIKEVIDEDVAIFVSNE
jgi:hypothetical protein